MQLNVSLNESQFYIYLSAVGSNSSLKNKQQGHNTARSQHYQPPGGGTTTKLNYTGQSTDGSRARFADIPVEGSIKRPSAIDGTSKPIETFLTNLLQKCSVSLISDAEIFPKTWLPNDFWTNPDFSSVELPQELTEGMDCW